MEFRILGSMEVLEGPRLVDLPAGRGRALLALLVLHVGETISADRLIEELWGEHSPVTAATVVQGHVSKLRKLLEPGRSPGKPPSILQTVGAGYRLAIDTNAVDANRFKSLFDRARGAPASARADLLADALRLWRGPALDDFTYEPFAQRAIMALDELRLAAIEERIDADLALGRHDELAAEAERLVAIHPFRERLRGQLMLMLYRAGRQAEALESYRQGREELMEELGLEPSPALRELEAAILRQDPALDLPPAGVPAESVAEDSQPAVGAADWLPRVRRTVTVAFADLSAAVEQEIDPEALWILTERTLEVGSEVLRRHGARVEQVPVGMLLAFFGVPVAHEDDALRAVRATLALIQAVEDLNAEALPEASARFSVRAGVETGEVVVGGASPSVEAPGLVVPAAARLRQAAAGGEVLVGASTQRLIIGAVVLKPVHKVPGEGSGDAMPAWRVLELVSGPSAAGRHLDAPMFGRQAELTRLRSTFRSTVRSGTAGRFTIIGEPGIGKSRLARDFAESIASDALVVTGRCPAYGEGMTFLPLREVLLEAAGPGGWPSLSERLEAEDDGVRMAGQVAGAIGFGPPGAGADKLFPAVRRLFEMVASARPLAVVFEDLHWAEQTLLDLIEYLGQHVRASVLLLCLAREELIEDHPGWAAATGDDTDTLVLQPLSMDEVEELLIDRAEAALQPERLRRLAETARGNPLFAEQLLAASYEDGVESVPASLKGLLAMRLDRLGPAERDLLRCAAVVGTEIDEGALSTLLPPEAHPFIARHLEVLERKQLIELAGDGSFRFRHVLIQLAAYQSMTRIDRASLHERFANWLEANGSSLPDLDELAGYHLEQAAAHRRASGGIDGTLGTLANRAGEHLANAADRALARFDQTATENLLSRALSLLAPEHERRPVVTQQLAEISLPLGRHARGQELLRSLAERARAKSDTSSERSARLEHARIQLVIGPDPIPLAEIRQEADEAASVFAGAGDDGGRGRASFLIANVYQREGAIRAAEHAYRESLGYADRSGQIREQLASRWLVAQTVVLGPAPVAECIEACESLMVVRGIEHPGVMTELAMAYAMAGRFGEARRLNDQAQAMFIERMRVRRLLRFVANSNGFIELLAGEYDSAERHFRFAVGSTREMGEREPLSLASARLASALRGQGRVDEAASYAELSAQQAPSMAAEAQARSSAAIALAAADARDHEQAERLAKEGIRWAPEEMINLRADVLVSLAEVMRIAGNEREAKRVAQEAAALFERKGNVAAAERVATFPAH